MRHHHRTEDTSRTTIDVAIGVLVGLRGCAPEEAFAAMMGHEHYIEEGRPAGMVVGWPFA